MFSRTKRSREKAVGGEFLPPRRCPAAARVAAILGARVLAAVRVAVVVLEPEARGGAADHPGPRAVVADMEGDADLVGRAVADVHDQPARRHLAVGGVAR